MISYLQIDGLTKSIGDRMLFSDMTLGIYEGDKIGIVARNGAGKTTLLNIIMGREDYDSGNIVFSNGLRVGYLPQTPDFEEQWTVNDFIEANVNSIEEADKARRLASQFGINDFSRILATLSGGQLKRIAVATVIAPSPDMLILDEPTNHLDIDMIEWLEQYLTRQRLTLLMVTHDRYFLDKICSKIIEIDREQVYSYDGNFDYYLRRRAERMDNLTAELARVKNLLRTEAEWMSRQPQARGSKAKYRIDNFHQLEEKSRINLRNDNVELGVASSYIGSKIFEAKNVSKSFGDIHILKDWSYNFARYEKVGIVGDNGAGKTTFIKLLQGLVTPDSGNFDIGQTVRWGYYSQEGITDLDERKRVIDAITEIAEEIRIDDKTRMTARQFLNRFLFTSEDQQKYIYKLSGGEKRRLYLATVLMKQPNFLILDEPTNDLDIMTLTILEDYLASFKGCVIVVSHDRFFLDRIVDHLFVFEGNGIVKDFPGDYSTWRHCVEEQRREERQRFEETKNKEEVASKRPPRSERPAKLSYKEKREMESLEKRLEEISSKRTELEKQMNSGTLDHIQLAEAADEIRRIIEETDEAELRLLELMEKES